MSNRERKIVRWVRQGETEYFERRKWEDWYEVNYAEVQNWKPSSYEYIEMHASEDDFRNRTQGMIRWD